MTTWAQSSGGEILTSPPITREVVVWYELSLQLKDSGLYRNSSAACPAYSLCIVTRTSVVQLLANGPALLPVEQNSVTSPSHPNLTIQRARFSPHLTLDCSISNFQFLRSKLSFPIRHLTRDRSLCIEVRRVRTLSRWLLVMTGRFPVHV